MLQPTFILSLKSSLIPGLLISALRNYSFHLSPIIFNQVAKYIYICWNELYLVFCLAEVSLYCPGCPWTFEPKQSYSLSFLNVTLPNESKTINIVLLNLNTDRAVEQSWNPFFHVMFQENYSTTTDARTLSDLRIKLSADVSNSFTLKQPISFQRKRQIQWILTNELIRTDIDVI